MNRRDQQANIEVGLWPLASGGELPRVPRGRRLRRQLRDYQSDALWSLITLLLLVWMTLVALTLWH